MTGLYAKLPYGAQFEVARLVNIDKAGYEDLSIDLLHQFLQKYKTNATAAPQVNKFMVKTEFGEAVAPAPRNPRTEDVFAHLFEKENRARDPWEELDKEEEALARSPYGVMGLDQDGTPSDWYGGQVQFRGTLTVPADSKELKLRLEKPTMGPSTQFARRFGSKHIFRIKLTRNAKNEDPNVLLNYFRRPFIICGGVFRAFYSKEDNVFLVRTNERWTGSSLTLPDDSTSHIMSFMDFIEWHNSLNQNCNQAMAKWASRFSLGLSNSVPGLLLPRVQVQYQDDIVNKETDANMTDGAGSMNRSVARKLRHRYDWEQRPSAIQVRVNGAKGLLVEDGKNDEEDPSIFLTPSQIKIKYPETDNDPAHLSIDVLRASQMKSPCRLSAETIVNLGENGVGKKAFIALLRNSLEEIITPLLDWEDENALLGLWWNIQRRGGVLSARQARQQPGIARLKGLSERDLDENEIDDEDGFTQLDGADQRSSAWWADPVGGCPSSLEETVMGLLDAGFRPDSCPVLRDKLKNIVKGYVRREIRSYRPEVPMSCSAFIIPDRLGLLAEGQVFIKGSGRDLMLPDGTYADIIVGEVLLARHPCKLPTDIRKWVAVDLPQLHHLDNVIVFSTVGARRAADWLAGGDYDGDKAMAIWQPELVQPFRNAPAEFADPPEDMEQFFEKEVEHVSKFLNRTSTLSEIERIHELQHYLLGAIRNTSVVGKYSKFHDYAIYMNGYTDDSTRRLAFMFCMTLDGAKTGMTVKPEVLKKDQAKYGHRTPLWKETDEEKESEEKSNRPHPRRPISLGRFIMDELHAEAEKEGDKWLSKIDKKFEDTVNQGSCVDPDLAAPYREILDRVTEEGDGARLYAADLELIRKHVEMVHEKHDTTVKRPNVQRQSSRQNSPRKTPRKDKKEVAFSELRIEDRQDILRSLSRKFATSPKTSELHMPKRHAELVKASYAYVYDCEKRQHSQVKWSRFPWDVAFRTLCDIKAQAIGNHKTVTGSFYERFNVKMPKSQR
ncbi:hypothetical protein EST38_g1142 [Candolleomyces aberdarensis]|uniref:RNA-dependent RNA polymerase n=1 Tax=Candolleomyces aberdarensis TaxID=2316362 RepID=A0A4Q2DWM9_9AGAR|nr:hypothetical protein EST38_g1142 [Candolleomyces aberdarensis]